MFLTRLLKPTLTASAHCDLPCGIYDPEQARIEAESVYKIIELCWKAAKQCSKVKGSLDLGEAKTLLEMIDKIADVWTKAGGPQATRVAKAAAAKA